MLRAICLLLLLWGVLGPVFGLDKLEYDAQVAPPAVAHKPSLNLWRGFMGRVREVFRRWQPTTKRPRLQLRSTTPESEPELEYYGALNPIYQTQNF